MDIKNPFATGFNLAVRKRRAVRGRIEDRFRFAKIPPSITEGEKPVAYAKGKRRVLLSVAKGFFTEGEKPAPSASAKPIEKR